MLSHWPQGVSGTRWLTRTYEPITLISMSQRLQVLLDEDEFEEIRGVAAQRRMTVSEWVRQVLRDARRGVSTAPVEGKLMAVREAALHAYPTADIDQMNAEIERGYRAGSE